MVPFSSKLSPCLHSAPIKKKYEPWKQNIFNFYRRVKTKCSFSEVIFHQITQTECFTEITIQVAIKETKFLSYNLKMFIHGKITAVWKLPSWKKWEKHVQIIRFIRTKHVRKAKSHHKQSYQTKNKADARKTPSKLSLE